LCVSMGMLKLWRPRWLGTSIAGPIVRMRRVRSTTKVDGLRKHGNSISTLCHTTMDSYGGRGPAGVESGWRPRESSVALVVARVSSNRHAYTVASIIVHCKLQRAPPEARARSPPLEPRISLAREGQKTTADSQGHTQALQAPCGCSCIRPRGLGPSPVSPLPLCCCIAPPGGPADSVDLSIVEAAQGIKGPL
jgi:hypothetical protein